MAVLTPDELLQLRKAVSRRAQAAGVTVTWVKGEASAALQAIEDLWEAPSTKAAFSAAIDAATTHGFTNQEKKILGRYWLQQKAAREDGVI